MLNCGTWLHFCLSDNWFLLLNADGFTDKLTIIVSSCINWIRRMWLHGRLIPIHFFLPNTSGCTNNDTIVGCHPDGFIDDHTIVVSCCINWIRGMWLRGWLIPIHFFLLNAGWCIDDDTIVVCRCSIIPRMACINLPLPQLKMFLAKSFTVAWGLLLKFHTCLTTNYISAFFDVLLFYHHFSWCYCQMVDFNYSLCNDGHCAYYYY